MKNWFILSLGLIVFSGAATANDIYISQVGDGLDLAITQDGSDNEFGDSTTSVTLTGDTMTFTVTQTGNNNDIAAIIKGNTYTGTWAFTGDYNVVDLKCDSTGGLNCETVTLDITTTGDSNTFDFDLGSAASAERLDFDLTILGDSNVWDIDIEVDDSTWNFDITGDSNNFVTSQTDGTYQYMKVVHDGDSGTFVLTTVPAKTLFWKT